MKDKLLPSAEKVREKVHVDTASKKHNIYTVRRGYFYTSGGSSEKIAARVLQAFPNATILDHGNHWAPFRGAASVKQGSHWWVKFSLPTQADAGQPVVHGAVAVIS